MINANFTRQRIIFTLLPKYVLESKPIRKMKKKESTYTCHKSPPGPYYRPYEIKNNFKPQDIYNIKAKTCKPPIPTAEITAWNPFAKENPVTDKCLDRWGQMVYRDTTHVHGGFSPPKPKPY